MYIDNKALGIGLGVLLLIGLSAGVAAYVARDTVESKPAQSAQVSKPHTQKLAAAQPAAAPAHPACDDGNIVGTVAGGAAGGLIGSQIGDGRGKTAATIGGVIGGAYLGNQALPTRNITCR